jgi:RimJ/RimL family protein N-acetyltransferase
MQREHIRDPGASLLLRAPTEGDLAAIYQIHADPMTNQHNPSGPMRSEAAAAELLQGIREHWACRGFGYWMVCEREAPDRVIGIGGLMDRQLPGVQGLNLYYRFRPEAWGRGLATGLALQALALAAGLQRRHEVYARVRPGNLPSIRVLERVGMVRTGSLQDVEPALPASLLYTMPQATVPR